ncbi:MAG: POTRA domain-containing protein [Flavitalea sp.]
MRKIVTNFFASFILILAFLEVSAQPENNKDDASLLMDSVVSNLTSRPVAFTERKIKEDRKSFEVGEIEIRGNKKTKDYIILRELHFKSGDSVNLTELVQAFEVSRQQLMNTRLYNEVVIALKNFYGHIVNVTIEVKERWYIFPIPYVKPVDRNLSEWAKQGYAADRINLGFKFTYYNFSGRNDKLRLWLITGYSKQIQFQYDQPNADRSLKRGYKVGFNYSKLRETNFLTQNNQQVFSDSMGQMRFNAYVEYDYRPGLRTFHALRLGYTSLEVDNRLIDLNPKYFNQGSNVFKYPELSYSVNHFNVDYIPYPLTGWMGEAQLLKRGINQNTGMWQMNARLNKNWKLSKNNFYSINANGMLKLPFDQPFVNSQMFGFGDFYLRGLEKYVIDGVAGLLLRQTMRKRLFKFSVPTFINSTTHNKIPFTIYAKTFFDAGYAHNKNFKENSLVNKMLYTTGLGIDVVTFYDVVVRFDYSFNQLGQNGLFLHIKNDF